MARRIALGAIVANLLVAIASLWEVVLVLAGYAELESGPHRFHTTAQNLEGHLDLLLISLLTVLVLVVARRGIRWSVLAFLGLPALVGQGFSLFVSGSFFWSGYWLWPAIVLAGVAAMSIAALLSQAFVRIRRRPCERSG